MLRGSAFVRGLVAFVFVAGLASSAAAQTEPLPDTDTLQPALAAESTASATPQIAGLHKMGALARRRHRLLAGRSRFIVSFAHGTSSQSAAPLVSLLGGTVKRSLPLLNAKVIDLPNAALEALVADPSVARVSVDRRVVGSMERTGATIGAAAVRQELGLDGTGVGIAVIDSGIAAWHDDLASAAGGQRVTQFVDLVNGWQTSYDDYGHGTHVAGIIAGNGFDSNGARTGIAPGANLVVLKVLDDSGAGYVSDVIAALDYVVAHKDELNIRVVNLSIATPVYESYNTDPLTLAAKRAVDAGIVVVAAAGNRGRNPNGREAYGGITAPGNAPWVLTVGASSHMGTVSRDDDTMAAFSSRGPTAADLSAKPDLVAPGVGIAALSSPDSRLYQTHTPYLLAGTVPLPYLPYLSLSGTSMAAPVVSGTVALMLQANPALTPNAVKAILQFTSQVYASHDTLSAGAGFLNAAGAVQLARYLANPSSEPEPDSPAWSRRLIWGNRLFAGGRLLASANAWDTGVTWGAPALADGLPIEWGTICASEHCESEGWRSWNASHAVARNVVWGLQCGGADCASPWSLAAATDESVVWGTSDAESVVWGTSDDESVVWGTSCGDAACVPVVWSRP